MSFSGHKAHQLNDALDLAIGSRTVPPTYPGMYPQSEDSVLRAYFALRDYHKGRGQAMYILAHYRERMTKLFGYDPDTKG